MAQERKKSYDLSELSIAHAAMKFIASKGLTDEFYLTAGMGQLCDDTCMHERPL